MEDRKMSILDVVFIGSLSAAILFAFFSIIFFIIHFIARKQVNKLKKIRVKNKKKRRIQKKKLSILTKKSRRQFRFGIAFLILGLLLGGGASFTRYYQATNLGSRDSETIVEGYYLLEKTTEHLTNVKESSNMEKSRNNLRELSAKLSGFGVKFADSRLTMEGQRLLNKYYKQVKELGLNLNNQSIENLQQEAIKDQYMANIQKIQTQQKKVFTYFKVNESALKQKK